MSKNRNVRNWVIYGVLLVILVGFLSTQLFGGIFNREPVRNLNTSEFSTLLRNDQIVEVSYSIATATLNGRFLESEDDPAEKSIAFTSTWSGDEYFNTVMNRYNNNENLKTWKIDPSNPNSWMSMIPSILLFVLFGALIWFMFTQFNNANNKQMQFGKTKAKKAHEERPTTKFVDVAGIDEAVEELQEIKDFLTNPKRYVELGAKIPRGVLLVGPPGTGKTLLARAVAGEAGVPFFSISGSDFVEMFVGVGASRVRDLFEQAKQAAPAIIFIDEIDAVGRQRGAGLGGGHDEREQTLNQLLVEMDGFDGHQSVILIAATNRMDILDPALLRPGRFDRQIVVMRPDLKGREQILKVHAEGKPLAHSVELEKLARMTPGFTGADLANLMNEAALLTARKGKKLITMSELDEAMEREIAGPERKSRIMTEKEKRIIAFHEAGHAMVGHVLENADPVHKISIISRGQALGYTLSLPAEDRFLSSRNEMYDELAMFLGGRVSEEIFCDDITTGASNDLERATKMARQMVTRYGMTEALGSQVYGEANHEVFLGRDYAATPDYSEATAQRIDEEVARIMGKAHDVAHNTLDSRREQMELIASVLMERETVEGKALEALLNNNWDDYLEHEDEYLTQKAEAERKQIEDDERHAAEERAKQLAMMPPPQGHPVAGVDSPPSGRLSTSEHPGPQQRPTLEDIFSGRVDLDELVQRRFGGKDEDAKAEDDGQGLPNASATPNVPPAPSALPAPPAPAAPTATAPPASAPAAPPATAPPASAPAAPAAPTAPAAPMQDESAVPPEDAQGAAQSPNIKEAPQPAKKPRKSRAKKGDDGQGEQR